MKKILLILSISLLMFKCKTSEIVSISIESISDDTIDFLEVDSIQNISGINGFQSSLVRQPYRKTREGDIFTLIESGYKVVDEQLFNSLDRLRKSQCN